MNEFPKVVSASQLDNNMIRLEFENREVRLMHPHFVGDINPLVLGRLFGLFSNSLRHSKFEINDEGDLIRNGLDVYTAEELWQNSERIKETLDKKFRGRPILTAKWQGEEVELWRISRKLPQFVWIHQLFDRQEAWWAEEIFTPSSEESREDKLSHEASWIYRKTDSNKADTLIIKKGQKELSGKLGDYLVRKMSDKNLVILTDEKANQEIEV